MLVPLLELTVVALGLISALALFLSLKHEVRERARKDQARIEAMLARLQEAERPVGDSPVPALAPLRPGMNMSKRVQALRLLRRGEDIGHVSAALGAPRREIELLIRVHKLSAQRAASAGPP